MKLLLEIDLRAKEEIIRLESLGITVDLGVSNVKHNNFEQLALSAIHIPDGWEYAYINNISCKYCLRVYDKNNNRRCEIKLRHKDTDAKLMVHKINFIVTVIPKWNLLVDILDSDGNLKAPQLMYFNVPTRDATKQEVDVFCCTDLDGFSDYMDRHEGLRAC